MHLPDLTTEHLSLVAITTEMVAAEAEHPSRLAPLLQAAVPDAWPDSNWEPHVLDFIRRQILEQPSCAGWNRYVVLNGNPAVLIGTCCAFPQQSNTAEIGYSILAPWQGRGYATEATRRLLQELFQSGVECVVSHTYPHLTASLRVMEKCGMEPDGMGDGGTVRYCLRKQPS